MTQGRQPINLSSSLPSLAWRFVGLSPLAEDGEQRVQCKTTKYKRMLLDGQERERERENFCAWTQASSVVLIHTK